MSAALQAKRLLRKKRRLWCSHSRIGWVDSINYMSQPIVEDSNCLLILRNKYRYQNYKAYDGIYRKKIGEYPSLPEQVAKYPSAVGMVCRVNPIYDCANKIIYFVSKDFSTDINYLHKFTVETKRFQLNIWKFTADHDILSILLIKNNDIIYFYHMKKSSKHIINYGIVSVENMKHKSLQNELTFMKSLQHLIYLRHTHSLLIVCNNSMIYRKKLKEVWQSTDSNKWEHIVNFSHKTNHFGLIMDSSENILLLFGGNESDDILSINIQTKSVKNLYWKCPTVGSFYAITTHRVMENRLLKLTFGFIRINNSTNLNIPNYLCHLISKFAAEENKMYLILHGQSKFQTGAPNIWSVHVDPIIQSIKN